MRASGKIRQARALRVIRERNKRESENAREGEQIRGNKNSDGDVRGDAMKEVSA